MPTKSTDCSYIREQKIEEDFSIYKIKIRKGGGGGKGEREKPLHLLKNLCVFP